MVATAVRQAITCLEEVHQHFGLVQATSDRFFFEWQGNELPVLSASERESLDQVRDRFRYHRRTGLVDEGVVSAIVISRLMELAGFYDPPFRLRAEVSIQIESQLQPQPLRGRIDFLVMCDRFWQAIIESKDAEFDLEMGIPQTLAYMMGAPGGDRPRFGMVTNGNSYIFLKVQPGQSPIYDYSEVFGLLSRQNRLYDVLRILKRLGQIIAPDLPRL